MKKHLFVIAAICMLAGSSCQKTESVEPKTDAAQTEDISTRAEDPQAFFISGPSSITYNSYGSYSTAWQGNGYYYHWSSSDGDIDTDSEMLNIDLWATNLNGWRNNGWIYLRVDIYTDKYEYLGYGYKEVYVTGVTGSGGSGSGGGGGGEDEEGPIE